MTGRLRWRDAEWDDRQALMAFTCTEPAKRSPFGRTAPVPNAPELEAQSIVRDLRPPAHERELMLLAEDQDGIAAVAWTQHVDDPYDVFVKVMAVALRMRGQGVGLEMLDEVIDRLANRAEASDTDSELLRLSGNVHVRNAASQKFCQRARAGVFEGHGELDEWVLTVDLTRST